LELVEPSKEIYDSYMEKSKNCLKSARVLLKNELYENSISMSYYAMYNSLTALLHRIGIDCENHFGSILLLKVIFDRPDLFESAISAKEERESKQYHISSRDFLESSAESMIKEAEDFSNQIRLLNEDLTGEEIKDIRRKLEKELS